MTAAPPSDALTIRPATEADLPLLGALKLRASLAWGDLGEELRGLPEAGEVPAGHLPFVFLAEGSDTSTVMTVTTMRGSNVLLSTLTIAVLSRQSTTPWPRLRRPDAKVVATIATTDTSASLAYGLATTSTLLSLASVLGSLYPAMTALLAWRFHKERLKTVQKAGVGLVLVGVAAIAGG